MATFEQIQSNLSIAARSRAFLQEQGYMATPISTDSGSIDEVSLANAVVPPTIPMQPDSTDLLSPSAPPWSREVRSYTATRPSRASSVVSTRTRFSTTTLQDDARSIDINLGGQYFRISRDGSRVTSDVPPPPYPGREETFVTGTAQLGHPEPSGPMDTRPSLSSGAIPGTFAVAGRPNRPYASGLSARISDPSEVDIPSPVDPPAPSHQSLPGLPLDEDLPSRSLSYNKGPENLTLAAAARQRRTVSQDGLPDRTNTQALRSMRLRRRGGIRLPSIITDEHGLLPDERPSLADATANTSAGRPYSHSAGPSFPSGQNNSSSPRSPTYIGRNATGTFPVPVPIGFSPSPEPVQDRASALLVSATVPRIVEQPSIDSAEAVEPQISVDSENDVSLHYTRMIRFIDRDHRRALHNKDKELAQLRERLNEVDTVYRQELKARDFIIDDLKKRLANLEENTEEMLEKARNQVEDVWEHRWKEQEKHLVHRYGKLTRGSG